jgi:hypothetical protein
MMTESFIARVSHRDDKEERDRDRDRERDRERDRDRDREKERERDREAPRRSRSRSRSRDRRRERRWVAGACAATQSCTGLQSTLMVNTQALCRRIACSAKLSCGRAVSGTGMNQDVVSCPQKPVLIFCGCQMCTHCSKERDSRRDVDRRERERRYGRPRGTLHLLGSSVALLEQHLASPCIGAMETPVYHWCALQHEHCLEHVKLKSCL